jgi:HNH endonuclease
MASQMRTSIRWWKSLCYSRLLLSCKIKTRPRFKEMMIRFSQVNTTSTTPVSFYIESSCLRLTLALWIETFAINDEPWLVRTISLATGTRLGSFCNTVRERDRRCVVSGVEADAEYDNWTGFEAAHIFPLAYEEHWKNNGYDHWITIPPDNSGNIDSVQNGILLDSAIHQLFDSSSFSINPDVIFARI